MTEILILEKLYIDLGLNFGYFLVLFLIFRIQKPLDASILIKVECTTTLLRSRNKSVAFRKKGGIKKKEENGRKKKKDNWMKFSGGKSFLRGWNKEWPLSFL